MLEFTASAHIEPAQTQRCSDCDVEYSNAAMCYVTEYLYKSIVKKFYLRSMYSYFKHNSDTLCKYFNP